MIEYLPANSQTQISFAPDNFAALIPLAEMSRQATTSVDIDQVLDTVCQQARLINGADRVVIVLFESNLPVKLNYQGFGPDFDFSTFEEALLRSSAFRPEFYQPGETLVSANLRNDPQIKYSPALEEVVQHLAGSAWLLVPFRLDELNSGLIWAIKEQPYEWPATEVSQAENFGAMASLVINNTRMKVGLTQERERRSQIVSLARTAAHDLNQQLSVLQAELDLAVITGQASTEELLNRMQLAVEKMTDRVRSFQKTVRMEDR